MKDEKNIEIVNGDGSNLDISPVYENFNIAVPKSVDKKPKYVVVPKEVDKKEKKKDKKKEK